MGVSQAPAPQTIVINLGDRQLGEASLPLVVQLQSDLTAGIASPQADIVKILKLAQTKGGSISLVDAVIELGKPTAEVRSILAEICADELMEATNNESTGAVIYRLI